MTRRKKRFHHGQFHPLDSGLLHWYCVLHQRFVHVVSKGVCLHPAFEFADFISNISISAFKSLGADL